MNDNRLLAHFLSNIKSYYIVPDTCWMVSDKIEVSCSM